MNNKLIALVDCNNFFVSCERLFNPKLNNKPVAVLSQNDGCIVARSAEVKKMGVPMGAAYFKWRDMLDRAGAVVCSSNYALYGDLSTRVMRVLHDTPAECQVYSIDEAFLTFDWTQTNLDEYLHKLRARILQWVGIPVSIGLGTTKTMAKAANYWAKKHACYGGVYNVARSDDYLTFLSNIPVKEVWGIGWRYSKKLKVQGITNAAEFIIRDDAWIRKNMTVTGLRTVWELRGKPCIEIESIDVEKKSIVCSRSFNPGIRNKAELSQAVALYTSRAVLKLRKQKSACRFITVFIRTNRFNRDNYYSNSLTIALPSATNYTPTLLAAARQALDAIFRSGCEYKKAGVLLTDFIAQDEQQLRIDRPQQQDSPKQRRVMRAVDSLNERWGRNSLNFAATGVGRFAKIRQLRKSNRYTTEWTELLKVKV